MVWRLVGAGAEVKFSSDDVAKHLLDWGITQTEEPKAGRAADFATAAATGCRTGMSGRVV